MRDSQRYYTEGEHGQVHYRAAFEGVPLLLIHQAPMSYRQFDIVFPALIDRGLRPIAIDIPGFGNSDPPAFIPSIGDYASAPINVMDALGIERVSILGHHTGSLIATETALQFPDRIDRLILNGPLPLSQEQREDGLAYVEAREKGFTAEPDGSHLAEAFQNRMQYANSDTDWSLASRYIGEQLTSLGPFWYGHNAAFRYDHAASLVRVKQPTMILTNTGDEIYSLARMAHTICPEFAWREIQGGGVDIVDEKPDSWAECVQDFVLG